MFDPHKVNRWNTAAVYTECDAVSAADYDRLLALHEAIQKTITKQVTRTRTLLTLQEYADSIAPERYRQPLKTIHEALAVHGWDVEPFPEDYKPICCGAKVECRSFLGDTYLARCASCKKFVLDVTGPSFGNSWVSMPDSEKVDLESDMDQRWIAGVEIAA